MTLTQPLMPADEESMPPQDHSESTTVLGNAGRKMQFRGTNHSSGSQESDESIAEAKMEVDAVTVKVEHETSNTDSTAVTVYSTQSINEKVKEDISHSSAAASMLNSNNNSSNNSNSSSSQNNNNLPVRMIMCGEDMPKLPDDTEDVDEQQECEHYETRQSFLNLCQGNHYQFDQLRRAKHTSMMVLYHLHNPDAPKFVPSCNVCHSDILTGMRYRCEKCEIDFCQPCFQRIGSAIHSHPLSVSSMNNSAPQQLTEEQRRERARSIKLHLQLLFHASACLPTTKCESKNCARMKVGDIILKY